MNLYFSLYQYIFNYKNEACKKVMLRKKTILLISVMMLSLLGSLFYISTKILLQGYVRLEEQEIMHHMERLQLMMNYELHRLDQLAHNYASWDDTYNYMAKKNSNYINDNMYDQNFVDLDINLLILVDSQGKIIWGKGYNIETRRAEPIPAKLIEYISRDQLFLYNDDKKTIGKMQYTVMLPEGFLFIAARPIFPSKDNEPILPRYRGTLIMAHFFRSDLQARLAKLSQIPFVIKRLDQPLPKDFMVAFQTIQNFSHPHIKNITIGNVISDNKYIYLQLTDKHTLLGYALIYDTLGYHSLIMRISLDRYVYTQGKFTLYTLSLLVIVASIIFTILFLVVLQKIIINPLVKLHQEVEKISFEHNILATVSVNGNDEISQLAQAINRMMYTITEIRHTEDLLGRILDRSFNEIYLFETESFRFIQVNQSACKNLGYVSEELKALTPEEISPFCNKERLEEICHILQTRQQEEHVIETSHKRKDGSLYPVEVHLQLVEFIEIPMMIAIAIDISERKKAQTDTLRILEENRRLAHRTLTIQETERKHIARELHDEFGQCLTAIQADASTICALLQNPQDRNYISAQAILSVSKHMYSNMHSIIERIRPNVLDALGLKDALEDCIRSWQKRHTQTQYYFDATEQLEILDEMLSISIYRVVQECLTNIAKHAQAKHAWIKLHQEKEMIIVTVKDDGQGMTPDLYHYGLGLIGIRERAQSLSGHFDIKTALGDGTTITFSAPIILS